MDKPTPYVEPVEGSKEEQVSIARVLLEQGKKFQNVCEVTKNIDGTYHVVIESFVFELDAGVIDITSNFIPYRLAFNIDYTPISFHYNKPIKNPDGEDTINFNWDKKSREDKPRIVLPVARIKAPSGSTLARPNHMYYNGDGKRIGVSSAIIAINIALDGTVTNENRYYPEDCAPELLANIANGDPTNICTLRTFSLNDIKINVENLSEGMAQRVQDIQNPLS